MKAASTMDGTKRKNHARPAGARNFDRWLPVLKHLLKKKMNEYKKLKNVIRHV
jgi:hypothetical protein